MPNDPKYRQYEMDWMKDNSGMPQEYFDLSQKIDGYKSMNKKSEHQLKVEQFMIKAGQEVPDKPTEPPEEDRVLRAKLILEEALETVEAMGVKVYADITYTTEGNAIDINFISFNCENEFDMVKVIDGCTDIAVVTTGTLSACGIEDLPVQEVVNNANLRKFGPGGYRRDDGKWMKPPDFVGPEKDIQAYLDSKNDKAH